MTGFYLSQTLKRRIKLFETLALLSENIALHIRYNSCDIFSVLQTEQKTLKSELTDTITQYLAQGNTVAESFIQSTQQQTYKYVLHAEDKEIIRQFGSKLGASDTEGQLNHCEYFKTLFSEKAKRLQQESIVKGKLYRSLGFFSGMAIAVVVI